VERTALRRGESGGLSSQVVAESRRIEFEMQLGSPNRRTLPSTCRLGVGYRLLVYCARHPPSIACVISWNTASARQANISSENSAGHVMRYRHFSMPLASANLMVIMWRRVWEEDRAMERPTRAPAQTSRATQ
jgi:hypothetical protein